MIDILIISSFSSQILFNEKKIATRKIQTFPFFMTQVN